MELDQSNDLLDLFQKIQLFNSGNAVERVEPAPFPDKGLLPNNAMCFYRIDHLSFNEEYPRREAFENVLMALDDDSFNFVYLLEGSKRGIELYIGIVKNCNGSKTTLTANNYGEIVESVFEGNFSGSHLSRIKG